jgi:hypothetical protein
LSPQIVIINRKKYAVGLFWQPVAAGLDARSAARSVARSIGGRSDLFIGYRAMVGVGSRTNGHSAGMPAAAAEAVEAFAEFSSFLAMFRMGDKYWMVVVRNGIVLKDALYDDENIARNEFLAMSAMPDWGALFAPADWNLPKTVERDIVDIVVQNVRATLKVISRLNANFGAIVLTIAVLFGVGYVFRDSVVAVFAPTPQVARINPAAALEYKRKIAEEAERKAAQIAATMPDIPATPIVMPYDILPKPMTRAQQCYQAIGFLMQPIQGWVQSGAECAEEYASAVFKRDFGTLNDFYAIATELFPGAYVVEKNESEVSVRVKLPTLDKFASQEERDPDTVVRAVNTLFQAMNAGVDVNIVMETVGTGVNAKYLNTVEVGAESKLVPYEFIKIFDEFSGVRVIETSWDARSKTWNYEVIIYAK